jgi:hypothetical protein
MFLSSIKIYPGLKTIEMRWSKYPRAVILSRERKGHLVIACFKLRSKELR